GGIRLKKAWRAQMGRRLDIASARSEHGERGRGIRHDDLLQAGTRTTTPRQADVRVPVACKAFDVTTSLLRARRIRLRCSRVRVVVVALSTIASCPPSGAKEGPKDCCPASSARRAPSTRPEQYVFGASGLRSV